MTRYRWLLMTILLFGAAGAQAQSSRSATAYWERGTHSYAKGDIEGAINDFSTAIAFEPGFAMAYNNRGIARYVIGDFDGALSDYNRCIALNPRLAVAYNNRGLVNRAIGDIEAALADYDKAIALNPNFAMAYYNRGIAQYLKGDLDGAILAYDRAIAGRNQLTWVYEAMTYNNRGVALQTKGDLDKALSDYNKAISLNERHKVYSKPEPDPWNGATDASFATFGPGDSLTHRLAGPYNNRGALLIAKGQVTEAVSDLDRAILINPHDAGAYANRGFAMLLLGRVDDAQRSFTRALQLDAKLDSAIKEGSHAIKHRLLDH